MEGIEAHSWICARVLRRHFMFQLINVFLGVAISTGMLSVAIEFADHPTSLAQILGVYVCVSLYVCIHVSVYVYISLHVYLCVCPCGQEQQIFFVTFLSAMCALVCVLICLYSCPHTRQVRAKGSKLLHQLRVHVGADVVSLGALRSCAAISGAIEGIFI